MDGQHLFEEDCLKTEEKIMIELPFIEGPFDLFNFLLHILTLVLFRVKNATSINIDDVSQQELEYVIKRFSFIGVKVRFELIDASTENMMRPGVFIKKSGNGREVSDYSMIFNNKFTISFLLTH